MTVEELLVQRLPPVAASALSAEVLDMFERVAARTQGEFTAEDVLLWMEEEKVQLFAVFLGGQLSGIIITEIVRYPRMDTCHVLGLAGDRFLEWPQAIRHVEDFARQEGCQRVTWAGRRGLAKIMKDFGYKVDYTVMGRDLEV